MFTENFNIKNYEYYCIGELAEQLEILGIAQDIIDRIIERVERQADMGALKKFTAVDINQLLLSAIKFGSSRNKQFYLLPEIIRKHTSPM